MRFRHALDAFWRLCDGAQGKKALMDYQILI